MNPLIACLGNGAISLLTRTARCRYRWLDADDLAAETCRRALKMAGRFDRNLNPYGLLLTIMRHLAMDISKSRRIWGLASIDNTITEDGATFADILRAPDNTEREVERNQTAAQIEDAIAGMPAKYAASFRAVFVERKRYKAAAKGLRIPVGTLRSRSSRGKAMMRKALS